MNTNRLTRATRRPAGARPDRRSGLRLETLESRILLDVTLFDTPEIYVDAPSVTVDEGAAAVNTGTFFDPDFEPVTVTASTGTVEQTDGWWGWYGWAQATTDGPSETQAVTLTATDTDGLSSSVTFDLIVNNVAPVFEAGPDEALEASWSGALSRAGVAFTDPGADVWSAGADFGDGTGLQPLPVDQDARTFDLSHTYAAPGVYTVTVTLQDDDGGNQTDSFQVTVPLPAGNALPTVAVDALDVTADEGQVATNAGSFDDPDAGDAVTLTASVGTVAQDPGGSGTWTWSYDTGDGPADSRTVTIAADDGNGGTVTTAFSLTVNNVAPTVDDASAAVQVSEAAVDGAVVGQLAIIDPGGDATTVVVSGGTGEAVFGVDAGTGVITVTDASQLDYETTPTYTLDVTVTDSDGAASTSTVTLDLIDANDAPVLAADNAAVTVSEGQAARATGTVSDPDSGDAVTVTASLGSVTLDPEDGGAWTWDYDTGDGPAENRTVTVTADDGNGGVVTTTFDLTVLNAPPRIDGAAFDAGVEENSSGGAVVGTVSATDPGGDTLTYAIVGGTGATAFTIDPATGEIAVADGALLDYEATPALTLEVEVTDSDGAVSAATLTVDLVNQPSLTGSVFLDADGDGAYGAGETGLDGVTLELLDADGTPVLDAGGAPVTAVTSDGGFYLFEDLAPGTYQVHEIQPTGVDDGTESPGTTGGSVVADDTVEVVLDRTDGADLVFAEQGTQVGTGDTATIGFWHNKNGQALIRAGGAGLADWLTANFSNVFGDTLAGADGDGVAAFYRKELFRQKAKKSGGPSKVDAQFMAVALATYFTNRNLAGEVAAEYGFTVTDTGTGARVVNVGDRGAAFGVADGSELTVMQLLRATDSMTDAPDAQTGFVQVYDGDGDGVLNDTEIRLRVMANEVYTSINETGDRRG